MPEIAGEGALLVNPFNTKDITEKILQLENDETFYQQPSRIWIKNAVNSTLGGAQLSLLLDIYKEFAK